MHFSTISVLGLAAVASAESISVTPHASYASSAGVLGCKIDTNRVAYWPGAPDCNNMCVKVSNGGRSVHLLHVDQSAGAHDISYDAWNYLVTGKGATEDPTQGGGFAVEYENVHMSECAHLIKTDDGKLAFEAANSINFLASCINEPSTWIAQNYAVWNIANSVCTLGIDEECTLDLATSNQPTCPHTLGLQEPLSDLAVVNIDYGTGATSRAVQ
ncbi:hypothetical protein AAFC00_000689 [Neodothiora populina]|uniref:Cerato-platanin n=1 Tax=Neodothiora populina TaxID=2781224 RepID=A0ABR3PE48_9PEZI